MASRVMLIQPPLTSDAKRKVPNHQVPMGLMYMAGVLEKEGFEVKILDCPLYFKQRRRIGKGLVKIGLSDKQIEAAVKDFSPQLVGISCSFSMFEKDAFEIVDLIKKIDRRIKVVVGGAHVSSNPEYVLRNRNIDLAVVGEGEITMLEIAKRVRDGKRIDNIQGTALMKGKDYVRNKNREYIRDLDEIEAAWHLIDLKKYFEHPDNSSVAMRKPSIHIITSRGCPGNCVFCSVHTVWGRKWRARSAKKVVDEIEMLYKKGVKHFRINDDNLTLDKKRVMEICKEIIRRKIDIKWDTPSGVAFWTLDEEVLSMMKKAGYYRITFGIESGCKETQKYIGKNIDFKKVERLVRYCHEIGLWVASFFIIGFPYETREQVKEAVDFIVNSDINFPFVFVAQPYPGTRMYEDFRKEKLLGEGFIEASNFISTKYHSKYFSAEELNRIRRGIYKKFYLRKMLRYTNPYHFYKEFLSKIRSYEDVRYVTIIFKNLISEFWY